MDSASERLRTEIHRTTLSLGGKVRAFATSLLSGGPAAIDWPPVDVVLLERATGQVVKRWHEHGNDAVVFMSALDEDLDGMTLDEFLEKWAYPEWKVREGGCTVVPRYGFFVIGGPDEDHRSRVRPLGS